MKQSSFRYTSQQLKFLLLFSSLIWFSTNLLHAQNNEYSTKNYLESSISIQKTGMIVLGSWAMLNIFSGIPGTLISKDDTKYFYQMNSAWNLINLGIATFGYTGAIKGYDLQAPLEVLAELQKFDRILLINAGLDLAYISTGVWLWNKGIKDESMRLKGYGKSIVLQGSFLLLFDSLLYLIHHRETTGLSLFASQLSFTGNGFSLAF